MKNLEKIERYFELIYTEVVATKTEVVQLNSRMTALEGSVLRLDSRMTAVEGSLSGLDSRMSGLDSRMTAVEGSLSSLDSRMLNVERGIGDLRADNRAIRADLKALRRERADS